MYVPITEGGCVCMYPLLREGGVGVYVPITE